MKTYGYDYTFAISVEEINEILSDNLNKVDIELKYSGEDKVSGSAITLDAKTSAWQIVKGGQNVLLRFSMPISDGYLSIEGPISNSYDLTDVTVLIEVSLGWLGTSDTQETKGSGDLTKLIFSPTGSSDPNTSGYVNVVNILDPDKSLDTVGKGLLRTYTTNILFENRKKINFIFAEVFPQPKNVGSWLQPYKWIYYYSTGKSYDALCFLCLLSDKPWPTTSKFDSTVLTSDHNSTILVSQASFFNNVVLPSIKSALPGGNFSLSVSSEELCTITNNGDFSVTTTKGNITANSFKLTTSNSGNGLTSNSSGSGPLKFLFGLANLPNASYSWSCEVTNPLQYSQHIITFLKDKKPIIHHNQTIHWYDWLILVVVGITSLPGLIEFIIELVNGISDQVNDVGVDNINNSLETAVDGSMVNLAELIDWQKNGQKFSSDSAGLDGAMYVYGDLK